MPASQGRPTLLRLCHGCGRVVIATTAKLLNTKLKAHRRIPPGRPINGFDRAPMTAA